jgi:3-hydroxyacyl-CoA dehydrogenase/enoyl-CoA hydratase/3-hydroxybutyryl-CoA epimerase
MNTPLPVTYSADADRVGWIVFDDPTGKANVFNAATLAALGVALDTAEAAAPRALVIASGKERIFIAGADLKALASLPDAMTATEFAREGQQLFARLTDFSVPVVCAIHGACAGGGYELALACHRRIASDASATRIGLPETGLGLIPGWGGTVRLPRLLGAKRALDHILKAQLLDAASALAAGLVDAVVPAAELRACAKADALRLAAGGAAGRPTVARVAVDNLTELRETTRLKARGRYPALLAAIYVVERSALLPLTEAFRLEAGAFGALAAGECAKNLLHVFAVGEAAKKRTLTGWFSTAPALPPPIKCVGIVGAGVMGAGIAQWCAARGFDVVLRDVQPEFVAHGLAAIHALCDDAVKRRKMTTAEATTTRGRITTTTGWDGFERCDLVIEAIVENVAEKQKLFSELAGIVRPDVLLASNTSALPIEDIAGHVSHPERTLGLHFFNPVSRLPLVEVVIGSRTDAVTAARALAFVKTLGKSAVVCRASAGFVVTRLLFFYLNEAVRLWDGGVPPERLDSAMREWGWPMGPLRLIDEVGVDVTDSIFGELEHYFPSRFRGALACGQMVTAGLRGRKTGAGFYTYPAGAAGEQCTRAAAGLVRGGGPHLGEREIQTHLMAVMCDEAQRCLDEGVVKSPDDIDFALLSGAGFPAFRGGLMRFARSARASTPKFVAQLPDPLP